MPRPEKVASIGVKIGSELLLFPGVTADIREGGGFNIARSRDHDLWSPICVGVEPGEEPTLSLAREAHEETGASVGIRRIVAAYGGPLMTVAYSNGDQVGYVPVAFGCGLLTTARPDSEEVTEVGWFSPGPSFPCLANHG